MQVVAIIVSFLLTAIAVPMISLSVWKMFKVLRVGQPAIGRTDKPVARLLTMVKETLGHTRMLQWTWVGILHWFAFAAFLVLSTAVAAAFPQLFWPDWALPIIGKWFVYEWIAEGLGLLGTLAIIPLIIYRLRNLPAKKGRKSRFFGSTMWQAFFVEAMVLLESAAILFIRGAEYNLALAHGGEHAEHATAFHFPISQFFANLWPTGHDSIGTLENIIFAIAMFKISSAMIWLIVIASNMTMGVAWHRFTAWFNIFFKRESDGGTALGGLVPLYVNGEPLDLEKMEDLDEDDFAKLGVGKVEDFSWKGLLDFTTCTECGRCQSQCPAWNTEKPLSPKLVMMGLREHAYTKIPLLSIPEDERTEEQIAEIERPLIGDESMYGVIDPDVLWSCTNCGACVQQCPVDIEHVDHIDNMRRYQVLVESNFPAELNNIFKGLERKGNPWNMNPRDRMKWADGLDFEVKQVGVDIEDLDEVEWLFWVGCAGAYEDRAKKTTQAVAELLDMAGVTFAVLGDGETCTGDSARRSGNEIVFQQLAMQNTEVFKEMKVKKVVSTCAHCFNTLKNEYKEFGVELEVVHHTQLLNRLVREGKLTPVAPSDSVGGKKITYHDPCFLGRHNQVYEAPRELLNVIPGATFTEMPRNSERSFCCGAGGARMWMEETIGSRINVNRTEEAIATGADQIAVGCPFCRVMLADGLTLKQSEGEAREEVEVLDVAQMLLASVKREPEPEPEPEPDPEVEAAVVAEAEAATAAAAAEATAAAEPADEGPADETGATVEPSEPTESDDAAADTASEAAEEPAVTEPETVEPEAAAEPAEEASPEETLAAEPDTATAEPETAPEPTEEPAPAEAPLDEAEATEAEAITEPAEEAAPEETPVAEPDTETATETAEPETAPEPAEEAAPAETPVAEPEADTAIGTPDEADSPLAESTATADEAEAVSDDSTDAADEIEIEPDVDDQQPATTADQIHEWKDEGGADSPSDPTEQSS